MIVITLNDIIWLSIVALAVIVFIIWFIICLIKSWYDKMFKKNCFDCKHYYLQDVAGAGDCCWYNCKIHNEYHKDRHSMNDSYIYRKCKDFEKEVDENDK